MVDQDRVNRLNIYLQQQRPMMLAAALQHVSTEAENEYEQQRYTKELVEETITRSRVLCHQAPLDDNELMNRWLALLMEQLHRRLILSHCYQKWYALLLHTALHYTNSDREEAEDLLQDIITYAMDVCTHTLIRNPLLWLQLTTHSRGKNWSKRRPKTIAFTPTGRLRLLPGPKGILIESFTEEYHDQASSQEIYEGLLAEESAGEVMQFLQTVKNAHHRRIAYFYWVEEKGVKEIADILQEPAATVGNTLKRVKNSIRKVYFAAYPEQKKRLAAYIHALAISDEEKYILRLYAFEGNSYIDIAKQLQKAQPVNSADPGSAPVQSWEEVMSIVKRWSSQLLEMLLQENS